MPQVVQSLINGRSVGSNLPKIIKVYPGNGQPIAEIEPATDAMLDEAVAAAVEAQKVWYAMESFTRGRILVKAAELMRENLEELSKLEVQDVGKAYNEAFSADVISGADALEYFGSLCQTNRGEMFRYDNVVAYTEKVPIGVCAGIGAWNFPAQIACWKAAPALAAGNAFILKPSELTPLVNHKIADILKEAGVPDGLFQIIHGDYNIGRSICAHEGIGKISLTGGVATGKLIMQQSASTLKKVTLELGGKSPLIGNCLPQYASSFHHLNLSSTSTTYSFIYTFITFM